MRTMLPVERSFDVRHVSPPTLNMCTIYGDIYIKMLVFRYAEIV
jgi:hypothetical protein